MQESSDAAGHQRAGLRRISRAASRGRRRAGPRAANPADDAARPEDHRHVGDAGDGAADRLPQAGAKCSSRRARCFPSRSNTCRSRATRRCGNSPPRPASGCSTPANVPRATSSSSCPARTKSSARSTRCATALERARLRLPRAARRTAARGAGRGRRAEREAQDHRLDQRGGDLADHRRRARGDRQRPGARGAVRSASRHQHAAHREDQPRLGAAAARPRGPHRAGSRRPALDRARARAARRRRRCRKSAGWNSAARCSRSRRAASTTSSISRGSSAPEAKSFARGDAAAARSRRARSRRTS